MNLNVLPSSLQSLSLLTARTIPKISSAGISNRVFHSNVRNPTIISATPFQGQYHGCVPAPPLSRQRRANLPAIAHSQVKPIFSHEKHRLKRDLLKNRLFCPSQRVLCEGVSVLKIPACLNSLRGFVTLWMPVVFVAVTCHILFGI